MTLLETKKKLSKSFYEYLTDRVLGTGKIANLGAMITDLAKENDMCHSP